MTATAGRTGRRCRLLARALRVRHARRDARRFPLALALRRSVTTVGRSDARRDPGAVVRTGPSGRPGVTGPTGGTGRSAHAPSVIVAGRFVQAARAAGPAMAVGGPGWRAPRPDAVAGPAATHHRGASPPGAPAGSVVGPLPGSAPARSAPVLRTAVAPLRPATGLAAPGTASLRTAAATPVGVRRRVESADGRERGGPMSGPSVVAVQAPHVVRRAAPAAVERPEPAPAVSPPAVGAVPDVDRLTEHVLREIDRRFLAHRERLGRG